MNSKLAKKLRRMARDEMFGDKNVIDRELVIARINDADRVVNEPISNRAMYLQLKGAYKDARRVGK